MKMRHGGDITTYSKLFQRDLIDFSSNINPLGLPRGLTKMWSQNFSSVLQYPDIKYRALRESVATYLGCEPRQVVVGNGAMEIIDAAMTLKNKVHLFYPSFGEYMDRAKIRNRTVSGIPLMEDFTVDLEKLQETMPEDALLILGNPNNPTGFRLEKDKLLKIYQTVLDRNGILVLDEAFFEFCERDYDSVELFSGYGYEQVIIIRAATKFFSLPGVRLGYACTNPRLEEDLREVLLPWNINIFADLAGQFIFKDEEFIRKSKEVIKEEREYLLSSLNEIDGLAVFPGQCNFLLIDLKDRREEEALTFFLERGILLRTCSSFQGLGNHYVRVAVKSRENNEKLVSCFREFYDKGE